mgnify:CR=1 FL=1
MTPDFAGGRLLSLQAAEESQQGSQPARLLVHWCVTVSLPSLSTPDVFRPQARTSGNLLTRCTRPETVTRVAHLPASLAPADSSRRSSSCASTERVRSSATETSAPSLFRLKPSLTSLRQGHAELVPLSRMQHPHRRPTNRRRLDGPAANEPEHVRVRQGRQRWDLEGSEDAGTAAGSQACLVFYGDVGDDLRRVVWNHLVVFCAEIQIARRSECAHTLDRKSVV